MRKLLMLDNKGYGDFNPMEFGFEDCEPSHFFGPHIRKNYIIHSVSAGKGIFKNEKCEYEVLPGQAFLIRPGEKCYYEADAVTPWQYTWISFNGKMAKEFDTAPGVFEIDNTIFKEMRIAFESNIPEAYLAGMIFKIYSGINMKTKSPDYVKKVIGYINTSYMNDISIEEIADSLSLNRKYLTRIFKEKTGSTIQNYLIEKRLSEAGKLLSEGYRVGECAYMTGYKDVFNFSKTFKKHFGKSPKEYIQKAE